MLLSVSSLTIKLKNYWSPSLVTHQCLIYFKLKFYRNHLENPIWFTQMETRFRSRFCALIFLACLIFCEFTFVGAQNRKPKNVQVAIRAKWSGTALLLEAGSVPFLLIIITLIWPFVGLWLVEFIYLFVFVSVGIWLFVYIKLFPWRNDGKRLFLCLYVSIISLF